MSIPIEDQLYYKKRQSKRVETLREYKGKVLNADALRTIAEILDEHYNSTLVIQYDTRTDEIVYEIHRWETKEECFQRLLKYL